jgi:hypothetical protein
MMTSRTQEGFGRAEGDLACGVMSCQTKHVFGAVRAAVQQQVATAPSVAQVQVECLIRLLEHWLRRHAAAACLVDVPAPQLVTAAGIIRLRDILQV